MLFLDYLADTAPRFHLEYVLALLPIFLKHCCCLFLSGCSIDNDRCGLIPVQIAKSGFV